MATKKESTVIQNPTYDSLRKESAVSSLEEARQAISHEDNMTLWEGLRRYPKAMTWSFLLSIAVIMEGFDTSFISNFYAYPAFTRKFGEWTENDGYQIPAKWQGGLSNGTTVGEIIGLLINGWACERYGYRKTMIVALVAAIGLIFMPVFAQNIETLQAYTILMGIPWGIFQTLTITYAAEVCPVVLRGYLTVWVNMCWHVGGLIAAGILRGLLKRTDEWGYRIPYATQWAWPIPLILVTFFAPESPWWLVRRGRIDDAYKSVKRLTSYDEEQEVEQTVAMIVKTHELEMSTTSGASLLACFKGNDYRRTEIACITWLIQSIAQSPLNGAFFFDQAGLSTADSFDLTMGQYSAEIAGTILAWILMKYFGRRALYLAGFAVIIPVSFAMGAAGCFRNKSGAQWAAGSLVLVNYFWYSATIGSVTYTIVPEVSSGRLRTKTVILARAIYNVVAIVNGQLTPRMNSKTAWNWGAKAAFYFGGWQIIFSIWSYFRLPETMGKSYAEIDALFNAKVRARDFKTTIIDPFDSTIESV